MASSRNYLELILAQCDSPEVTWRAMMGEYLIYYRDKLVGGIYDDRLLVKITPAAERLLPDAPRELPYEGAKEMLLVTEPENEAFLKKLFSEMAADLPAPKPKRKKAK